MSPISLGVIAKEYGIENIESLPLAIVLQPSQKYDPKAEYVVAVALPLTQEFKLNEKQKTSLKNWGITSADVLYYRSNSGTLLLLCWKKE